MFPYKEHPLEPRNTDDELDDQIQGLAHLMELSHDEVKNPEDVLKVGDEKEFKIIFLHCNF